MMDTRIKDIRRVLDNLARVERSDNDTKEIVYDRELARIRAMDKSDILDIVKKSICKDQKRRKYSSFIFSELYDVPGIETVFSEQLESADETGRAYIIQTAGLHQMRGLVSVLNAHFEKESDDFCRYCLLHALIRIGDESSLPVFTQLMEKNDKHDQWSLLVAGSHFASVEFKDFLLKVFQNPEVEKSHQVVAAWGLAKLQQKGAYDYLEKMLDDPDVSTPGSYEPGQSIRAAQAIADIRGWNFEWGKSSVSVIKQMVADEKDGKIGPG